MLDSGKAIAADKKSDEGIGMVYPEVGDYGRGESKVSKPRKVNNQYPFAFFQFTLAPGQYNILN
jgi:hypothetical protein